MWWVAGGFWDRDRLEEKLDEEKLNEVKLGEQEMEKEESAISTDLAHGLTTTNRCCRLITKDWIFRGAP